MSDKLPYTKWFKFDWRNIRKLYDASNINTEFAVILNIFCAYWGVCVAKYLHIFNIKKNTLVYGVDL